MKPGSGEAPATRMRVRKNVRPTRRLTRRAVLKMLSVMEQTSMPDRSHDPVQEFLTSGRTGRRNALPDILGEHATTSTGDLSQCLEKLTTSDADPSTSNSVPQQRSSTQSVPTSASHTASEESSTS